MNKFIAFATVALACLAAVSALPVEIDGDDDVASQLSASPNNDVEIANLEGKTSLFADFCIQTRDEVIGDIKRRGNGMARNIFVTIFNGAEEIGTSALNVQRDAADQLGAQIRDPSLKVEEGDDSVVAEGRRKIQESPNQARNFFQAVASALTATKNVVSSQVVDRLNQIKSAAGPMFFTQAVEDVCKQIEIYDQELAERFQNAKAELVSQEPSLADVKLEQVDCVTAKRIIRLDGICKLGYAARDSFGKAFATMTAPKASQ